MKNIYEYMAFYTLCSIAILIFLMAYLYFKKLNKKINGTAMNDKLKEKLKAQNFELFEPQRKDGYYWIKVYKHSDWLIGYWSNEHNMWKVIAYGIYFEKEIIEDVDKNRLVYLNHK